MKKRKYPKTVLRKKLFKGVFWTGFGLVLFLSVVAIIRVGNANAGAVEKKPVEQQAKKENVAVGEGAKSFAENFASQYFDWQIDDVNRKSRAERLEPFLAKGLDEQAGLAFDGMEWNSTLVKSQVWNVEETGKDTALITLRVQHVLKKITSPDSKVVEQAKKDKKEPPKPKEDMAGPYEKYFVVPVKTDGKAFVVNKIPYFMSPAKKPTFESDTTINEDGKIYDSDLQEELIVALNTFFKVYTTGTQDELSYYIKGDNIRTMLGIITFVEVKNTIIKKGESKDEYKVHATVVFKENQSRAQVIYPYEVTLVKVEGRWFIKKVKNQ